MSFILFLCEDIQRMNTQNCACSVIHSTDAKTPPRVIVEYDREPWLLDAGTVRVTFDCNVRAAVGTSDLFDPALPCLSVLDPGIVLLEVKYTEFLPQLVRDLLPPRAAYMTAFSKYTMCCEKTAYLYAPEYYCEEGNDMPARSRAFAVPYRAETYVFPRYTKNYP